MLDHPVGDREPGGGVVELDVAGEGRLAGEHDRGRVDHEHAPRGRRHPRFDPPALPGRVRAPGRRRRDRRRAERQARRWRPLRWPMRHDQAIGEAEREEERAWSSSRPRTRPAGRSRARAARAAAERRARRRTRSVLPGKRQAGHHRKAAAVIGPGQQQLQTGPLQVLIHGLPCALPVSVVVDQQDTTRRQRLTARVVASFDLRRSRSSTAIGPWKRRRNRLLHRPLHEMSACLRVFGRVNVADHLIERRVAPSAAQAIPTHQAIQRARGPSPLIAIDIGRVGHPRKGVVQEQIA